MIVYSIILFAVAAVLLGFGMAIGRGNTGLIHAYHQTNVKEAERLAYGKAFAKGVFAMGAALLLSGVIALLGQASASLIVLLAGLAVSMGLLVRAQKRYNGGVF